MLSLEPRGHLKCASTVRNTEAGGAVECDIMPSIVGQETEEGGKEKTMLTSFLGEIPYKVTHPGVSLDPPEPLGKTDI